MPDQRALLRGRLAVAIDGVADVASRLGPPVTRATAPPPPSPPLESVGRPWTLAAAMEPLPSPVVEAAPPPRASLAMSPPEPLPPPEHHRSRWPLAIIGSSFLGLVLIAAVTIRLLSGGTVVHAPGSASGRIALTGVRPVAAAPSVAGAVPATQVSFPAKTAVVDIEVNSGGAAGDAPVHVVVTIGQPAQTIIQSDYVLSQSGATVIPLAPSSGAFAPGDYSVTITYRGALLGSTVFAVH
jgi:hypothetical protein